MPTKTYVVSFSTKSKSDASINSFERLIDGMVSNYDRQFKNQSCEGHVINRPKKEVLKALESQGIEVSKLNPETF